MAQQTRRIVATDDVLDGEPRIEGRRIGVRFIHDRVEGRGLDPRTVADRHDLDVADVYRALTYYHDHSEEMAELEAEREAVIDEYADSDDVIAGPGDIEES